MSNPKDLDGPGTENWTALRLVILGFVTLAVGFGIIHLISETALH